MTIIDVEENAWIDPPEAGGTGRFTVEIDGEHVPVYVIDDRSAQRFSDLRSIAHDLLQVAACCQRYGELEGSGQSELATAVIDSALIRYRRCFNQGKRYSLPKGVINDFSEKQKRFHQYALDMGDKHIAHSVSDFEQFSTVVAPKVATNGNLELGWLGPCDVLKGLMIEDVEEFGLIARKILEEVVVPSTNVLWGSLLEKWSKADRSEFETLTAMSVDMNRQMKVKSRPK